MRLSDLQFLMHQLGPAMPEITIIVQESHDCWSVEFDEGVALQITWAERSMRVLMKCAIGRPDERKREAIYASLLNANLQLTGIADVKLALNDSDDDVMLIGEHQVDDISIDSLRETLVEFLGFAGKFSLWIAGASTEDSSGKIRSIAGLHHDTA